MTRAARVAGLTLCACALSSCSDNELGHPPIARIDMAPVYVAEGDNFATVVTLDGTRSCDELDEPDTCVKLDSGDIPALVDFRWAIADETAQIEGSLTDPRLSFRVAGDKPIEISLTVTDANGAHATARMNLGISIE